MGLLANLKKKIGYFQHDRSTDHLPCYINRITVIDSINTKVMIRQYIRAVKQEYGDGGDRWNQIGMFLFSVTEKDRHHQKWLDVAKKDGYTVVEGPSIHGPYKCWSIFVPNTSLTRFAGYR